MEKLRMVDLCAGTGGFILAFSQIANVVLANDHCPFSKSAYTANFHHRFDDRSIADLPIDEIPDMDILTGGFPCQPFSIAGKQLGFGDSRSNVFWRILQIIDAKNPSIVVLENVKNLTTHDNGNTFRVIIDSLRTRGYAVNYSVINTANVSGIPQHRERIYIVATHGVVVPLNFARVPKRPLSDFLDTPPGVPEKYYTNKSKIYTDLTKSVKNTNTVYQYRRVYVRENQSGECPTLTANMGTGGHNVPIITQTNLDGEHRIRKITPREAFRLQGFPDTYVFPNIADSHIYKLAGNAITVSVARLIADEIARLLSTIRLSLPLTHSAMPALRQDLSVDSEPQEKGGQIMTALSVQQGQSQDDLLSANAVLPM